MKTRLITTAIVTGISALVGVGVAIWIKSDQMVGIVIAAAVVGLIFGSSFKFRLV